LLRCGFQITEGGAAGSEQRPQTPFTPVSCSFISGFSLDTLLQDQTRLKEELFEVKQALFEEKALMPSAMRIYCMPFLPSRSNFSFLLPKIVSTPCSQPYLYPCS